MLEQPPPARPLQKLGCGTLSRINETPYVSVLTYRRDPHRPRLVEEKVFPVHVIALTTQGVWTYAGRRGRVYADGRTIVAGNAGAEYGCSHVSAEQDVNLILCLKQEALDPEESRIFVHDVLPATPDVVRLASTAAVCEPNAMLDTVVFDAFDCVTKMAGAAQRSAVDLRMARAKRFIEDNFARPLSLREVAAIVSLSPFRFLHRFKQRYGITPYALLLQRRIMHAKDLLRYGTRDVASVGRECGFPDISQFSRAFRQMVGVSPRAYRRQYRRTQ